MAGLPSAGSGTIVGWLVMILLVVFGLMAYDYWKKKSA